MATPSTGIQSMIVVRVAVAMNLNGSSSSSRSALAKYWVDWTSKTMLASVLGVALRKEGILGS